MMRRWGREIANLFLLRGIFRRTLLFYLLSAGIPLLVMIAFIVHTFEEEQQQTLSGAIEKIADKKKYEIENYFDEKALDAEAISLNPMIPEALVALEGVRRHQGLLSGAYSRAVERFDRFFVQYREKMDLYDLFLINRDGNVIYTAIRESDFGANLTSASYEQTGLSRSFFHAKNFLEPFISTFRYYAPSGQKAVFIAIPVIRQNRFLGVLAMQLSMEKLLVVLTDTTGIGETGETVLVHRDKKGIVYDYIAGNKIFLGQTEILPESPSEDATIAAKKAVNGERGRGLYQDYAGREVIAAWSYLPNIQWGMIVKQETEEAFAGIRNAKRVAVISFVVIFAIALLLSVQFARSLVEPIRNLTQITEEIANGNHGVRAVVFQGDEVGDLARSFNKMTDKLETTLGELKETKEQLILANDGLEMRVQERTRELEKANSSLEREIQERIITENKLRLAAKVIENTGEAVVITDRNACILDINNAYTTITGYTREEMIGKNPSTVQSGLHDREFYHKMWSDLLAYGEWSGEIWDRKKDGSIFPKLLTINTVLEKGEIAFYVGIFKDITQIKHTEEKLHNLSYYDPLTGLPNRSLLFERLNDYLAFSKRHANKTGVLSIDLNRFKYINDSMGHAAGDMLLQQVATRLKNAFRDTDMVARVGGDEFVVIVSEVFREDFLAEVARKIIDLLSRPVSIGVNSIYINAAIGISVYPDDGRDADTILKNADIAMSQAKVAEKDGSFRFYTGKMNEQGNIRLQLDAGLRKAIEEKQFVVYYQPQLNLSTGRLSGMEALVRWDRPGFGLVAPDQFIPFAEEAGFITRIEDLVVEEVCGQIKSWMQEGFSTVPVAINLSAPQFRRVDFVEKIISLLERYELKGKHLQFELTERILMNDIEMAFPILNRFDELGIGISIDDFGTGYSSLSYLNIFKVDKLKIDRSFVRCLPDDYKNGVLTRTIIQLARNLGIQTIAEGVETEEQKAFLVDAGCDDIQGYLYGRPVGADEISPFLVSYTASKSET